MSASIGVAHWRACQNCLNSNDGDTCDTGIFSNYGDSIICDCHRTEADERERAEELRADSERDEA